MKKLLVICLCLGIAGWGSVGFTEERTITVAATITLKSGEKVEGEATHNTKGDFVAIKGKQEGGGVVSYALDDIIKLERYYESGKLWAVETYKDGKLDGVKKMYLENGILQDERPFKDGKRDGISKMYNRNGQLMADTSYRSGKKEGVSRSYEEGILVNETTYEDDEQIHSKTYHNGTLLMETTYKNGQVVDSKIYD